MSMENEADPKGYKPGGDMIEFPQRTREEALNRLHDLYMKSIFVSKHFAKFISDKKREYATARVVDEEGDEWINEINGLESLRNALVEAQNDVLFLKERAYTETSQSIDSMSKRLLEITLNVCKNINIPFEKGDVVQFDK